MLFLFGDNIENGPEDVRSTGFWRSVLAQCRDFAERYRADGGDATVVHLPDLGIRGNSHFLFQERNSDALAALSGTAPSPISAPTTRKFEAAPHVPAGEAL